MVARRKAGRQTQYPGLWGSGYGSVLGQLLTSCVTLGKAHGLSELKVSHLQNGDDCDCTWYRALGRLKQVKVGKSSWEGPQWEEPSC
jgi:hypothetical protein